MFRRIPILCVLLLGALLLPSCAVRSVSFSGVSSVGEASEKVRYTLESDDGVEGSIVLDVIGHRTDGAKDRPTDEVEVVVTIDNLSEDPIQFPTAEAELRDDAGRIYTLVATESPPIAGEGPTIVLEPARRLTFSLVYDTGGEDVLETTGSVTLDWKYRFRGQETHHQTRFIPSRRTRVVHHYHRTSFGFGFGSHYHRGGYYHHGWNWCP